VSIDAAHRPPAESETPGTEINISILKILPEFVYSLKQPILIGCFFMSCNFRLEFSSIQTKKEGLKQMKRQLIWLVLICFLTVSCSQKEVFKGEYDRKGIITDIDTKENRVLIDDKKHGLIWIKLNEIDHYENFNLGQEVVVWVDGIISQTVPAQAKALHIESATPLPELVFENDGFPSTFSGFVTINQTRYKMQRGGFEWRQGNQVQQTDAASPLQIAEKFKAIDAVQNSRMSIEVEQGPTLYVYRWDAETESREREGYPIVVPAEKGRYIYEAITLWANGEVSFTFVIEVN
ncbi:DUF3221 domain-containing protein, partial [Peribacillus psychrosaccharolyticus]|uniref:DUF3221 domain-containing protein n=1 Tax=Peribacillus psychrosaccharolyticus TaxID=1407 RepID=UPI003D2ACEE0